MLFPLCDAGITILVPRPVYGQAFNRMTRRGNLIGKQLSKARNHLDLSQADVAAKCQRVGWDLSRDVLARIETGIRGISDKEIALFCEVLGIPVQELLPPHVAQGYVKTLRGK